MGDPLSHDALVERAGRWLLNTKKCKYVVTGGKPWACAEHPDAIGWLITGESIVVEVKTSLSDYLADERKIWRKTTKGMGFWKYYLTPPGLIKREHKPPYGRGLLETTGRIVKVIAEAKPRQDREWAEEVRMLLSRITRVPLLEEAKDQPHDSRGD